MRRPVVAVVGTTAVLLALAAPVLGLGTGTGALDQFPRDHEARQGFEAAAAVAGPGASSPVHVVVRGDDPAGAGARVRDAMAADPGLTHVAAPVAARDGGAVLDRRRADGRRRVGRRQGDGRPPPVRAAGRGGRRRARRRRRRHGVADGRRRPGQRIDVEDPALPARAVLPRAARPAALGRAAAQGGADEPAQRRRGVRRPQPRLRHGRHAHAAARARRRLRAVDGLRGVPALAHPRALRGDWRHAHARSRRASPRARARSPRRR